MRIPRPQRLAAPAGGAPRTAAFDVACALLACYPPIQPLEFPPIPMVTAAVADPSRDSASRDSASLDSVAPDSMVVEDTLREATSGSTAAAPDADAEATTFIVPVRGVEPSAVRDNYSASRGARTHNALDIMAPRGTPVLAAAAGRILRLSTNAAGGITIYQVDSGERYVFYYAHLQGYRKGLRSGMQVERGEVIGYVGTTGNAPPNTPHLHFQVMRWRADGRYWAGRPVNPHPFLVRHGQER
jgi:murein DD-endopeptidase MepM/ murein hydrolase activator NlpD